MSKAEQKKSLSTENSVNTDSTSSISIDSPHDWEFSKELKSGQELSKHREEQINKKLSEAMKKINTPHPETDSDKAVKKFLSNPHKNLKWISHESSMLVCSLISVSEKEYAEINLTKLPLVDQNIIENVFMESKCSEYPPECVMAKFDEYKNFIFISTNHTSYQKTVINIGNRVASIPPNEVTNNSDVKVERKGKDIVIGNTIKLEKNRIQNLANNAESIDQDSFPKHGSRLSKQKISGRNAYEIRADVLEMALDWMKHTKQVNVDESDVINVADVFYQFVEHK